MRGLPTTAYGGASPPREGRPCTERYEGKAAGRLRGGVICVSKKTRFLTRLKRPPATCGRAFETVRNDVEEHRAAAPPLYPPPTEGAFARFPTGGFCRFPRAGCSPLSLPPSHGGGFARFPTEGDFARPQRQSEKGLPLSKGEAPPLAGVVGVVDYPIPIPIRHGCAVPTSPSNGRVGLMLRHTRSPPHPPTPLPRRGLLRGFPRRGAIGLLARGVLSPPAPSIGGGVPQGRGWACSRAPMCRTGIIPRGTNIQ